MRLYFFSLQPRLPYLQSAGYVVHPKGTVLAWCSQVQLHNHKIAYFIQEQNAELRLHLDVIETVLLLIACSMCESH